MAADRRQIFHNIARHSDEAPAPYLVSAWQHLVGHEYGAKEFADTYIDFIKRWDWDWVKINPRAVYYAEAWGGVYDQNDYQGYVIPKKISSPITVPADIAAIQQLSALQTPEFAEALEAARLIRQGLEDRAVLQTIFSPLSVLLQIADLPLYPNDTYTHSNTTVQDFVFNQPEAAKVALEHIAHTLAEYAAALVKPVAEGGAGLDGIFYAITGTVSEDYFDYQQYKEFSEPYDRIVLDAIRAESPEAVVLFHTCQADSHAAWFDDGSFEFLQWDPFLAGNPAVATVTSSVPVVGARSTDFADDTRLDHIAANVEQSIAALKGTPFLLTPSCTVPTPASDKAFEILNKAKLAL
ncbi:uroporphyrinogen decarboxylase family protein [Bifidobacterium aquikefiricola]|uniref:Uroporphyrinogen decarboxylase family protein n=1 Tax=Bifidobacterium aquikefiricola TaxID=3059038 RepID=A0AB39U6M9_9BIFI